MNICQVLGGDEEGGLETHVVDLANGLAGLGDKVTLVAHEKYGARLAAGVQFAPIDLARSRRDPRLRRSLRARLRVAAPSIVHAHAGKAAALVAAAKPSAKTVCTVHNVKRSVSPYLKFDAVIGVSPEVLLPIDHPCKKVVFNGVSPPPPPMPAAQLRAEFRIPADAFVTIWVGRLVPAKRLHLLIGLWDGALGHLLIVGDGPERDRLRRLAAGKAVTFAGFRADARALTSAADLMVFASDREGFPYALAEALLARVPVVSTPVPGAVDLLPPAHLADIGDLKGRDRRLHRGPGRRQRPDAKRLRPGLPVAHRGAHGAGDPRRVHGYPSVKVSRPDLAVLILSDGIPGHVNQARGLVRWLEERMRVRISEHVVRLRAKPLARLALSSLIKRKAAGRRAYRLFHGPMPNLDDVDFVVSAGGNTAFANVILARRAGIPNAFLGSRRRLPGDCFTAHLTLEPTGEPSNIVMDIAPSPLSARDMNARGSAFRQRLAVERPELGDAPLWLIACGGDGAGKTYAATHWRTLGSWLNRLAAQHGAKWLISTSRRTGRLGEETLAAVVEEAHVAYAVWWRRRPERILGDLMGAAERLFVTTDSMSMINECIAAAKPLTLVETGDGRPDRRYRNALAKFERLGLCRIATPAETVAAADAPTPPPLARLVGPQVDELARRIADFRG